MAQKLALSRAKAPLKDAAAANATRLGAVLCIKSHRAACFGRLALAQNAGAYPRGLVCAGGLVGV